MPVRALAHRTSSSQGHVSSLALLVRRTSVTAVAMIAFVLAFAGGPSAAGRGHDQAPPVAAVDEATYDFGEVYEGEHLSHAFTIRNTGAAPLEIRDPAARAQNAGSDGKAAVTAALRLEANGWLADFSGRAAVSPIRSASQAGGRLMQPVIAAGGMPAAPS
jgi:hypothetical protein